MERPRDKTGSLQAACPAEHQASLIICFRRFGLTDAHPQTQPLHWWKLAPCRWSTAALSEDLGIALPAQWLWDILDEFVYHYQRRPKFAELSLTMVRLRGTSGSSLLFPRPPWWEKSI